MAAAMSCNTANVRIEPIQPDIMSATPPRAVPRPIPKVTKIVLIDIIVPRDSGACSRIKPMPAGKFMPKMKHAAQLSIRTTHKLGIKATRINKGLEIAKVATNWRFRPTLCARWPPTILAKTKSAPTLSATSATEATDRSNCVLRKVEKYTIPQANAACLNIAPIRQAAADFFRRACLKLLR